MTHASSRDFEARLLLLALPASWLAFLSTGRDGVTPSLMYLAGLHSLIFVLAHVIFRIAKTDGDEAILPLAAWLTGWGLATLFSLDPPAAWKQLLWVGTGAAAMVTFSHYRNWRILQDRKFLIGTTGAILLLTAIVFGREVGGAKAWLFIGPFSFQPSEFVKLALIVFLAGYLAETRALLTTPTHRWGRLFLPEPRVFAPMLVMWLVFIAILILQRDLGSAIIYFGVFLAMLFAAGISLRYMVLGGSMALFGYLGAALVFDHVRTRIEVWLNPWTSASGGGYQIVQGLFTLAAGGLMGRNDGLEMAQKTPAVRTDLIFTAIGEHWGFFGTTAVLIALFLLTARILAVAAKETEPFGSLAAAGFGALLAGQTFVIVGGTTRLLPLTGVTLPFISQGGSSMMASFLLLGLTMAVSRSDAYEQAAY